MSLVITADLRGFRIRESTDYRECLYVLDDGSSLSPDRCWPATIFNVEMAAQLYASNNIKQAPKVLKTMDQVYEFDADPAVLFIKLRDKGFTIDEETRIRRLMGPPLTMVQEDDIAPLIMSHVEQCEQAKKDPTTIPLLFGWVPEDMEHPEKGRIVFPFKGKLAAGKGEGGRISLFNNKQVILSFQDWHLVPKGSGVGLLSQFLKCEPTGATSIQELCGKNKAVVEDGILVTVGLRKLVVSDLSIDQFI